MTVQGSQGYINSSDVEDLKNKTLMYQVPLDCMWVINVTVGWKVIVYAPIELGPYSKESHVAPSYSKGMQFRVR